MTKKQEARKLTGADGAYVNVITKVRDKEIVTQFYLARGDELPANLADGEEERLEAAGAFAPDTHRERQARARSERNKLRGAIAGPKGAVNNPKHPDMSAPAPGTLMAKPKTETEATGGAAAPPATADVTTEEDDGLEASSVAELKAVADTEGVEYDSKVKKGDLVEAIRAARANETTE